MSAANTTAPATIPGADPMAPRETWTKPRAAKRRRLYDALATAIDREERARAKMRRAFKAWERAQDAVARLNKRLTAEAGSDE